MYGSYRRCSVDSTIHTVPKEKYSFPFWSFFFDFLDGNVYKYRLRSKEL